SAVAEEITKDSEYKGTRILMDARMDNVRLRIQIDFGVGDVMVPGPRMIEYPVFLGSDTIKLLAYPVESAIAEKLQAMVALGTANSRMKDFYDVWICSNHLDFNTDTLLKAVDATFKNRKTPVAAGLLFVGKVGAGMFDGRNICGAGSFGTSGQGRAHFPAADQELNDPILAGLRRVFIDTEDASFGHREDSAGFIEVSNGERDLLGWPEARKEAKLMEVSLRLTPVAMDLL
ncbi:MAG: hypothetical protein QOI59_5120, partial [Gammaproteobacteria bacterium]|nr:hypothetical protein [Gammaproteobacteria bacterium]